MHQRAPCMGVAMRETSLWLASHSHPCSNRTYRLTALKWMMWQDVGLRKLSGHFAAFNLCCGPGPPLKSIANVWNLSMLQLPPSKKWKDAIDGFFFSYSFTQPAQSEMAEHFSVLTQTSSASKPAAEVQSMPLHMLSCRISHLFCFPNISMQTKITHQHPVSVLD